MPHLCFLGLKFTLVCLLLHNTVPSLDVASQQCAISNSQHKIITWKNIAELITGTIKIHLHLFWATVHIWIIMSVKMFTHHYKFSTEFRSVLGPVVFFQSFELTSWMISSENASFRKQLIEIIKIKDRINRPENAKCKEHSSCNY